MEEETVAHDAPGPGDVGRPLPITRRHFLAGTAMAGVGATLAACGTGAASSAPAATGAPSAGGATPSIGR
jgi:hypothetical protein